jgi:hypothetical protein
MASHSLMASMLLESYNSRQEEFQDHLGSIMHLQHPLRTVRRADNPSYQEAQILVLTRFRLSCSKLT